MIPDLSYLKNLGVAVTPAARLSDYTTFQLGGPCDVLVSCETPAQIEQAAGYLAENNIKFLLIGGGSNIIVSDTGIRCWILRYRTETPLIQKEGDELLVSGATLLDHLARFAAAEGLEGINSTSGIPGTVGGAIAGNAGAFGRSIGDVLKSVVLIDKKGRRRETDARALEFHYRDSLLKKTEEIVVTARISLKKGGREQLLREREEILQMRREKHPDPRVEPSAGSIFRNIEPTSHAQKRQAAGWFLEQAGVKNLHVGGAAVFARHANIIVKTNGCRAQDVYDLSREMARLVKEKFGLELIREVRFLGEFERKPAEAQEIMW